MAERLAKKKAAKDRQDILDSLSGGLSYGQGGVDITPQLSQIGGMVKNLALTAPGTVADMVPYVANIPGVKGSGAWGYEPEDAGTSNFFQAGGQGLEQAGRRAVGDITAIPGVGKPSASPTATDIKRLGVIEGLSKAGLDYGNLALTAVPFVKPSAWGISNAYKDMLEARLAYKNRSPFPKIETPGAFLDVDALQGSRLPARIVDTPATPASRLAEAQTQRGLNAVVDQPMTLPSKNITTIEKSASGGGQQKLVLTNSDGRRLATVTYDLRNDPMTAMPSRIEVDYLKSNFEGQGHGQELMQNLYDRYPNSFIDWGETINPTSTYMAEKFADRYYDRTAYEPNIDQGVVGTEGMYSGEPDVFNTPATPATRLAEAQTQRALPPAAQRALPPAPTPEMTAQIQRQAARTELGLNIQDIEFPPKGNELLRPRMFDTSGYGVFPEDAWPELGLAQHNAGVNNTTMPQEMDALRTYFSNEYDSFQDLLRNPNMMSTPTTKIFQKYIEKIDNIFKVTSPTTENFKVFRGVNADSPMPDGEFVGAFYRSLKEGDFIVEPAYMSTSISKTVASEWANSHPDDYLLIIHAPKGSVAVHPIVSWEYGIDEIAQHMNAPSEQELLFNRGTVLKILSNDFGIIEAEMVPMYQQVDNPISTSGIKESLLKQYSYKDLAEMVAGEQSKADFYVEYFQTLPDLEQFLTVNKAQKTRYDLANTIVDLNQEVYESINPRDYWKFRDIVDQIVDAKKTPLTTNNRYAAAKELLLLLDKHGLLYDGTSEFIRNNLDDIFQPPEYNPIIDHPVAKFLDNLKKANKQLPTVLNNYGTYSLKDLVETIKRDPKLASKMIWNQYLQHVKKLPNSNADFIKQVEALPKFFVDGNVISYQEAILLKKNIDANKPIG